MHNKENQIVKWLERVESGNGFQYFDESIPYSFHKPKNKLTNQEEWKTSKRYKFFQKLKKDAKKCTICGLETQNLVIDHDHDSRKIRGVLCVNCNSGLGKFKDNVKLMKKAIEYLVTAKENEKEALDYYTLKKIHT